MSTPHIEHNPTKLRCFFFKHARTHDNFSAVLQKLDFFSDLNAAPAPSQQQDFFAAQPSSAQPQGQPDFFAQQPANTASSQDIFAMLSSQPQPQPQQNLFAAQPSLIPQTQQSDFFTSQPAPQSQQNIFDFASQPQSKPQAETNFGVFEEAKPAESNDPWKNAMANLDLSTPQVFACSFSRPHEHLPLRRLPLSTAMITRTDNHLYFTRQA